MNKLEYRATFATASIFSFRMLGLFMILPIFSLYAKNLSGTTPFLMGVALGVYGLTQALLQIPFGTLSDHFPRKKVIAVGLAIFIAGSLLCTFSHSIASMIIGRALQGAGAVGSASIALLADLVRPEERSKSMAFVGIAIGLSFVLAMIIGPLFKNITNIFLLSTLLGFMGLALLYWWLPDAPTTRQADTFRLNQFSTLIKNPALLKLDIGIFILHAILTACFVVLPFMVSKKIYLPTLLVSIVIMLLILGWAERKKRVQTVFNLAVVGLLASLIMLWLGHFLWLALVIFFSAFNILEANLPSLISKAAPPESKGSAIGIYSTCQFLGIFAGGSFGGWLYGFTQPATVLFSCAIMALLWLIIININ